MKLFSALLLFLWAGASPAVSPEIRFFSYQRPVENLPASAKQVCVALDPAIFAHTLPQLADLRLYRGTMETPYAIHRAEPASDINKQIAPLNLGLRARETVFDAAMPEESYGDVQLAITGHDFLATVKVTGSQKESGAPETKLGSYTVFDLTRQKLGRSTVLHLPQSDFRYLHFQIQGPISPANVGGIVALHGGSTEPKYVAVASTALIARVGAQSQVEFNLPAHTPVDRILFAAGAHPMNFSRDVRIRVERTSSAPKNSAESYPPVEATGNLLRLHRVEDGHKINEEHLAIDAPRMSYGEATHWTVTIENGSDAPILFGSVQLQMVERDVCFDAVPSAAYTLYYGDAALSAPQYDYAALFRPQKDATRASSGPEAANPAYEKRADSRPFTERHPILLWVALAAVILLLGTLALRTAKTTGAKVGS